MIGAYSEMDLDALTSGPQRRSDVSSCDVLLHALYFKKLRYRNGTSNTPVMI